MRPDVCSPEWRHTIDNRNRYLPNVPIYDSLPDGWSVIRSTLTQPSGTCWIRNGPFFKLRREGKQYKHALMWL
jgi:hypothetical protein